MNINTATHKWLCLVLWTFVEIEVFSNLWDAVLMVFEKTHHNK